MADRENSEEYILGQLAATKSVLKSYLRNCLTPAEKKQFLPLLEQDLQKIRSSLDSLGTENSESFLKGFDESSDSFLK